MEKRTFRHVIFHVLFYFLSFKILTVTGQRMPVSIRVGVVLDMNDYLGQMGLNCMSMALSEFYDSHNYYRTRLVLINRDSEADVVAAAAADEAIKRNLAHNAVVDLLKNVQVQAIIGPLFSTQASFMIALGNKAQVPVISFSATSPSLSSLRSQYFIRATLNDSSQVQTISAIIQAYGWREVVPIYEDNEFGEGIIPFLSDALEQINVRIPYRSIISPLATDDQITIELNKLMTMQTRVFLVHVLTPLGSRLFAKANQLGMMSKDYVWIITDGIAYELNSMDPSVIESMLGVIGVRPYTPKTKELDDFTIRYKKRIQENNPKVLSSDLNIFGLWAYDAVVALAMAAEKARIRNPRFQVANIRSNSTDLDSIGVSIAGPGLVRALSATTFRGLAGKFQLVDGQLQSPPYQMINLVGRRARVVGYWTKDNGIVKDLNFTGANTKEYSTSKSNFGSTIWPGDNISAAKGWVIPTNGKKLRIGVPVKDGFTEFVSVNWDSDNSTKVKGLSIDVFEAGIKALPYGVPYEYIPFAKSDHSMAGSYNELVYQVFLRNYDAVVGDVTIVANRSQYIDFTMPYMESNIVMVVPYKDDKRENAWIFVKPLTWELWLTSFCSFVFIGFLIWILEHRINEDFRGPPWYQVGMIFWFAFSTMVFAHKERVINNLSRFVLIIWFLVVLILTQSYTASLTSMLTVQQLHPTVTDVRELIKNKQYVGYKTGSFVYEFLKNMEFEDSRLVKFSSVEELDELFSKGSGNGGIAAAFHEIPYIKVFLGMYCSKYTMVGPTYKTDGFGFVFPIGSPLVPDVSRAILNVTESKAMGEIERKWLGEKTNCRDPSNLLSHEKSLGLASFWGLFLIMGVAGTSALIIYMIRFLRDHWDSVKQSDPDESKIESKTVKLFHIFNNRDLNSHTFKNKEMADRDQQQSPISLASLGYDFPPSPIFNSPLYENTQNDQGITDYTTENPQEEPSQMTNQEIELTNNEQLNSTLTRRIQ